MPDNINNERNKRMLPVDMTFREIVKDIEEQIKNRPMINSVQIAMSPKKAANLFPSPTHYLMFISGIGAVLSLKLKRPIMVFVSSSQDVKIKDDDEKTINIGFGTTNVLPIEYSDKRIVELAEKIHACKGNEDKIKQVLRQIEAQEKADVMKKDKKTFKSKMKKVETVNDLLKQFGTEGNA